MTRQLAITATHNYTAVGHGAVMTSTSVRAGLSRLEEYDDYLDCKDNPITAAHIRGMNDNHPDRDERLSQILKTSLENMLAEYLNQNRPGHIKLYLGVASKERPGPRYEKPGLRSLERLLNNLSVHADIHVIATGNASALQAITEASSTIESDPEAVCIVGAIDSLLSPITLDWFEKDERLKSKTYGRHHGFIPGEAVGFLIIEDAEHAMRNNRSIQARITGIGISTEPTPRATGNACRATDPTEACRTAIAGTNADDIGNVFTDLNGEEFRARQWGIVESRCFAGSQGTRKIWHPAYNYGDIGAAHGVVLPAIVAQGFIRNWLKGPVMAFCTDDHGSCGALILEK